MIAWSYGGGIQSVAIGVLVAQGRLPKPDLAAICDTSRERKTTWNHLRETMQPFLDHHGVKIHVVSHEFSRVDLYDKDGLTLIPAYTQEGRKRAFCSGEWKRDAMERWLRFQGVRECDQWIGFSLDEYGRRKKDHRSWCHLKYPLIDLKITREDCKRIITDAGLPLPFKSRCWCCPHQNSEEWQEVQSDKDDFAKAVALEKEINTRDPDDSGSLFLYSGRVPLQLATFQEDAEPLPKQLCETGGCWT